MDRIYGYEYPHSFVSSDLLLFPVCREHECIGGG
jgi:hypothetical protein